jgi:ABC-type Fe3+/spermidine/putrescine transport system ATPase subunit
LFALTACEPAGSKTADVVQAATRAASEVGQQLAEKAAALAQVTPEEARAKFQEFVDAAAGALAEVRDSETAQRIAAEVERGLAQLGALKASLLPKLELTQLQEKLRALVERFREDPRVVATLKALEERVNQLAR